MSSGNFKRYVFIALLAFFVAMPIAKSALQEASIEHDLQRLQMEYSTSGPEVFRARVDDVLRRAPLNPKDVEVQIQGEALGHEQAFHLSPKTEAVSEAGLDVDGETGP